MTKYCTGLVITLLFIILAGSEEVTACDDKTEFTCSNSKCIPLTSVSNSFNDCGDNSDEVPHPCRGLFNCLTDDRCIAMNSVLDGKEDCPEGSDEVKMIGQRCDIAVTCCFCDEYVAHSECVDDVCRCERGYYSNPIGNKCLPRVMGSPCEVTLECHAVNQFSHCDPVDHVCTCDEGLRPTDDGQRCVAQPQTAALPSTTEVAVVAVCIVVICILVIIIVFLVIWMCKAFVCLKPSQRSPANVPELLAIMGSKRPHNDALLAKNASSP